MKNKCVRARMAVSLEVEKGEAPESLALASSRGIDYTQYEANAWACTFLKSGTSMPGREHGVYILLTAKLRACCLCRRQGPVRPLAHRRPYLCGPVVAVSGKEDSCARPQRGFYRAGSRPAGPVSGAIIFKGCIAEKQLLASA